MVGCAAIGCTKRSPRKKKKKEGEQEQEQEQEPEGKEKHSFYEFPNALHDGPRFREWMHRLSRKGYKHKKDSRICESHFEESMFPEDLQLKLTGVPRYKYKYLTATAIPRKFRRDSDGNWQVGAPDKATVEWSSPGPLKSDSATPKPRKHTEARLKRMEQKRIVEDLLADKKPVKPQVPTKKAKRVDISNTISSPVTAATADMTSCPAIANTCEVPQQTVYGHPGVVNKDHSYAPMMSDQCVGPRSSPTPTSLCDSEEDKCLTMPAPNPLPVEDVTDDDCSMEGISIHGEDSDSNDNYIPQSSEESDSDEDISEEHNVPPTQQRTYLVFETNLEQLMRKCPECGKAVIADQKTETGSMVTYKLSCLDGHEVTWRSQPFVRQASLGNLMLAAAVLFTGLTYARLASMAKAINLAIFSKTTFNDMQRDKLFPVIKEAWEKETSELLSQRKQSPVSLAGDCRVDSPGHNGKYGTYTFMETSERPDGPNKILYIQLVQCTEVRNSNQMEPEGLQRGLKMLIDAGLKIATLATDRHVQIRKIMSTCFSAINHQFDIWHVSKSIVTKLNKKALLKSNAALLPWIQCVANHLWWCCATCGGDEEELRERWLSILNHVTNKHRWGANKKFKKCGHKRLTAAQCKKKVWLDPESSSFEALKQVVTDKYLLKSLPHLVKFHHTGALEVFHSQLLKYAPKRQHFGYRGMMARMMLAGLDWNSRVCTPLVDAQGKEKMELVFSKRRKLWVPRKRYHRESGLQVKPLMERLVEVHRTCVQLPRITSPVLPRNIARCAKPNIEDALDERRTRFKEK